MATINITREIKIFETKKTSNKNTGRGNTIIATSTMIPSGKIPDFRLSDKLPVKDLSFLVNSAIFNPPCQKIVTSCQSFVKLISKIK